jgi:DNA-binding Lrp family transcriptional regulator
MLPADGPGEARAGEMRAYILVRTDPGEAGRHVSREIRKLKGVTMAHDVTGPYDVVVEVETPSLRDLGTQILSKLDTVSGIARTITCPVITH